MRITHSNASREAGPPRSVAVAKGATVAPLLRRPLDLGPRRPPQRLRAPLDVPARSEIVIRGGAVVLR